METLNANDLDQFIGTTAYHRLTLLPNVLCTDGVAFLAEKGGAYWLIDSISIDIALRSELKGKDFLTIEFQRDSEGVGVLSFREDKETLYAQGVEWTDFPLEHVKFFYTDGVLMLPSEY